MTKVNQPNTIILFRAITFFASLTAFLNILWNHPYFRLYEVLCWLLIIPLSLLTIWLSRPKRGKSGLIDKVIFVSGITSYSIILMTKLVNDENTLGVGIIISFVVSCIVIWLHVFRNQDI